ncbi:MAG: hypothetical protein A2474_07060 [Elusimicrobia bacterium RIFOXYC2_FULL_34_12]|nr:MAG: hypothetical protein A2474_07060 [Elusimicrobia bacterium RIFOXYC2_FULL_34_12]OGS39292.1 MAG: hypothetical protein A2551_06960 [Elusimicrobia bacterium RIFOXYD2_FULL_34_30]
MAKELWQFIKSVILLILGIFGIFGAIALFSSGEDKYIFLSIFIVIISILILTFAISYVSNRIDERINLEKRERELDSNKQKLEFDRGNFEAYKKSERLKLEEDVKYKEIKNKNWKEKEVQNIEKLAEEKSKGFPFLSEVYKQYFEIKDNKLETILKIKSHPAFKAAEQVRQISKERREAEKAARESKYLLDYCKYLAPWLEDYIGIASEELDALIKDIHTSWEKKEEEFDEEVRRYYGPKYQDLSDTEKLQRKLDWYWKKPNKHNWQLGREYERYIGYKYEKAGCKVYYEGKKGFEDFGRDLITVKENNVEVIQCKRWRQEKTIHEKHVFYLFGTTVEYFISNFSNKNNLQQLDMLPELVKNEKIKGTIFTTTSVSEKAKEVAKTLGIQIVEKCPFEPYPSVKCNISKNKEKIYHLPFDQQYDTTLIDEEKNECYVWTIEEAEKLGFRHAWKWHGNEIS